MSAQIVLDGPRQTLASIPTLLGYQPDESVVVILLRGRHPVCTMRFNLGTPTYYIEGAVHQIATDTGADAVFVALFVPDSMTPQTAVEHMPHFDGLRLRDALWAQGGHGGSFLCDDLDCCPFVIPDAPLDLEVELGLPAQSRDDLRSSLQYRRTTEHVILSAAGTTRRVVDSVARRLLSGDVAAMTDEMADMFIAVTREHPTFEWDVRDRLLVKIGTGRCDRNLVAPLAQRIPDDEPVALTVLALYAHLSGDGTGARLVLDRVDPESCSLAVLVGRVLSEGVSPDETRSLLGRIDVHSLRG